MHTLDVEWRGYGIDQCPPERAEHRMREYEQTCEL